MQNEKIYVSELSASTHTFRKYHFCRGNSNRRKTRIGVIVKGSGTYIYLNKKLDVREGDMVFIPEHIYCYSEWRGDPEIEVVYVSCFMHYQQFRYEPQVIASTREIRESLLEISERLTESADYTDELEAYSLFYKLLQKVLPLMVQSKVTTDKTLQTAVAFITEHWNENFSVSDLAKECCVSESTLYHLFQKELGQSPVKYQNSIKINIAMEYLENSSYSVTAVSQLAGFRSENHFRKVFGDFVGTTPLKFRKSGK